MGPSQLVLCFGFFRIMFVKQHLHAMAYGSRYIWAALWDIVHPKYISDGSEVRPESESMMAHELRGL